MVEPAGPRRHEMAAKLSDLAGHPAAAVGLLATPDRGRPGVTNRAQTVALRGAPWLPVPGAAKGALHDFGGRRF